MKKEKKIGWMALALMSFSSVWGFGNLINGFGNFGGTHVILLWIIVFALYFIPYALMVGELGSAFKDEKGGVSAWIKKTVGPGLAYFAGWTYWSVHMPYLSQKPNSAIISISWMLFQENRVSEWSVVFVQGIGLVLFFLMMFIASRGINAIKIIASIAGGASLILSFLYIILIFLAPSIRGSEGLIPMDLSWDAIKPNLDYKTLSSMSILIFAVGGCEKVSAYVDKMKDKKRGFSIGMIAMAISVCAAAVLGTIAMGMMFDSNNIPDDFLMNGAFYSFQKLGYYYGIGNVLLVIFAASKAISDLSVLVLSIDAPLAILLDNCDDRYMPKALKKKSKRGVYTNGYLMIAIIVGILIIIPALGIGSVNELVKWLIKINSICMPIHYLWVFVAYIFMKKDMEKYHPDYVFTKHKTTGIIIGTWCLLITIAGCILAITNAASTFEFVMNICAPVILVVLGAIFPFFAKKSNKKAIQ